jgi:hypothetical protein
MIKDSNRPLKQSINECEALMISLDEDKRINIRAY